MLDKDISREAEPERQVTFDLVLRKVNLTFPERT